MDGDLTMQTVGGGNEESACFNAFVQDQANKERRHLFLKSIQLSLLRECEPVLQELIYNRVS